MNLIQLKALVGQAKTVQAANSSNPNIRDYPGEKVVVVGMHIVNGIKIDGIKGEMSKITYALLPGTGPKSPPGAPEIIAMDSFHLAAVEHATDLIEVMGENFPAPMEFQVKEVPIKDGEKFTYYLELLGLYDDPANPLTLQELDEEMKQEDNDGGGDLDELDGLV